MFLKKNRIKEKYEGSLKKTERNMIDNKLNELSLVLFEKHQSKNSNNVLSYRKQHTYWTAKWIIVGSKTTKSVCSWNTNFVEARSLVELFQDEPVDFLVSGSGAYYIALRQSRLYVNKSNNKIIEHRAIFQRERKNS